MSESKESAPTLRMASGLQFYTAGEVCDIIADDDHEFLFSGSDDDFDLGELEDEYDALDREQGT